MQATQKMFTFFIFAAAIVFAQGAMAQSSHSIYYIPFGAETFVAVTPDNIEEGYSRYSDCRPAASSSYRHLLYLLSKGRPAHFNAEFVRAKILPANSRWLLIDKYGVIRSSLGEYKIDDSKFRKVSDLLNRITTVRLRDGQ